MRRADGLRLYLKSAARVQGGSACWVAFRGDVGMNSFVGDDPSHMVVVTQDTKKHGVKKKKS